MLPAFARFCNCKWRDFTNVWIYYAKR